MISVEKKKKQGRNEACACGSGKKYKKCCGGFASVSESQQIRISSLIQEAMRYHNVGDLQAAEEIYLRVISFEKNNADALHLLGEIAYQRKDYDRAVDLIQQATSLNPSSALAFTNQGKALREQGNYEAAIDAFVCAIKQQPDYFLAYYNLADNLKKMNRLDARGLSFLMEGLLQSAFPSDDRYDLLLGLGFTIESERAWNQTVFEECIVPLIEQSLKRGDYSFAISASSQVALGFAQQPHTEAQWHLCHDKTNTLFVASGEKIAGDLPGFIPSSTPNILPKIGFIIDRSVSGGSGGAVVFNLIAGLSRLRPKLLIPIVYAFVFIPEALRQACLEVGVRIVDISMQVEGFFGDEPLLQRLKWLRKTMQDDHVSAVLYPGTFESLPCFAASIGLAPVQIYLSLGFRSLSVPKIQGYIVNGNVTAEVSGKKEVSGEKKWRSIPSSLQNPYPQEGTRAAMALMREVNQIRQEKFARYTIILGSIGRPQKIESVLFMNALARILKANANAVYLWFGPEELVSVRRMMEVRGISARCLFQGWVDARPYGKLLDIHLDTFPYAMGLSMHETMSAGTASVWMETQEGEAVGVSSDVQLLLQGKTGTQMEQEAARTIFRQAKTGKKLDLLARTEDEYVDYVQALIDDESFRTDVGEAGKLFMQRFMHDSRISAGALSRHIIEIIDEPRIDSREAIVTEQRISP